MKRSRPLILVVDYEFHVRKLLHDEISGFDTILAGNSGEAKTLYREYAPRIAVVLAQAEIRHDDGVSLTSWVLGQPEKVPIVLLNDGVTPEAIAARELWSQCPGVSWLDKPYSTIEIKQLLDRLTANRTTGPTQ